MLRQEEQEKARLEDILRKDVLEAMSSPLTTKESMDLYCSFFEKVCCDLSRSIVRSACLCCWHLCTTASSVISIVTSAPEAVGTESSISSLGGNVLGLVLCAYRVFPHSSNAHDFVFDAIGRCDGVQVSRGAQTFAWRVSWFPCRQATHRRSP